MKEEELKRLVEKYYNGESTEEEENFLRDFFRKDNVPEGYEADKEIFSFYTGSDNIPEPSIDFEARILAGIDASERVAGSQKTKRYIIAIMSAAAGLLLLAGSYFFFVKESQTTDTFTDPKIAYAETMKILMEVSSQLNHGTQALEPVGKMKMITSKSFHSINKSTRIIESSLEKINHLQNTTEIKKTTLDKSRNN